MTSEDLTEGRKQYTPQEVWDDESVNEADKKDSTKEYVQTYRKDEKIS